jgi:rod shape-determining protein MreC
VLYFIRKYRALLFATALLFSGVVILTSTHENRRDLGLLDRVAFDLTALFARALGGIAGGVSGVWSNYVFLIGVRDENLALRAENDRLRLENTRLVEAEKENERLRRTIEFAERTGFKAKPAAVIGSDVSTWFRTVTIDRGSSDGIERGMAVITPDGVVGRVHEIARYASKVLLLTDSNSSVDAVIQSTRGRGIVAGRLGPVLEMRYVHWTEKVEVGDVVVSSGMGGVFPKGLPVGVVSAVDQTSKGLFKRVDVTPSVDLSRVEEVLVVTAFDSKDYEPVAAPKAPAADLGDATPGQSAAGSHQPSAGPAR